MRKRMTFLAAFEDVCGTRPEGDRLLSSMKPGERGLAVARIIAKYADGGVVEEIRKRVQPGSLPSYKRVDFDLAVATRRDTWRGMKPDPYDPVMVALRQRLAARWALEKADDRVRREQVFVEQDPAQGRDGEGI